MDPLGILIEQMPGPATSRQSVEHVERKGLGHPDTMCDAIMEAISLALSQKYREICGRILHHNLDKGMLVAGSSSPALGGGKIDAPMRIIFGDRATTEYNGQSIPVADIAEATTKSWLAKNLRFVDPEKHIVFQNEIRPGSPELMDIFARQRLSANDTSAAVGYAPLTETERLVLAAERRLNSREFKEQFPASGEDVKIMAVRRERRLYMTVALAFVDRFISNQQIYFEQKDAIRADLARYLQSQLHDLDSIDLAINTLDDPERGAGGMYLTVLGTSAEGADGGQVGRGNRVNGVISLHRPMSTEAAAGKNPVSHVGKIYNVLSHQIAHHICSTIAGIDEATIWLTSQIGSPLEEPWSVAVHLILAPDAQPGDVEQPVKDIITKELQNIGDFVERLSRGEIQVVV